MSDGLHDSWEHQHCDICCALVNVAPWCTDCRARLDGKKGSEIMKFNFVDDVWTDQGGRRLTVELSENGGHVRLVLHAMENGPIAELTLTNYRMKRIWEGLEKAWAAKVTTETLPVQFGGTTSGSTQTQSAPDDSAPSSRTESEGPGSC